MYLSHPNKELINHILNILLKCDKSKVSIFIKIFHDIGKLNPRFQEKFFSIYGGYSHHSYLSCYYATNAVIGENYDKFKQFLGVCDDSEIKLIMIVVCNIIAGHHTNLRNIDKLFNDFEWNEMKSFLETSDFSSEVQKFIENSDLSKQLGYNPIIKKYSKDLINYIDSRYSILIGKDKENWRNNALNLYFDTITLYSSLIYADRKDASDNTLENTIEDVKISNKTLSENLENTLLNFKSDTLLNKVRTEIREQAKSNLIAALNTDERVFLLASPTGTGKTLTMLYLSTIIHQYKGYDYGIIYNLPFLSIIDQTSSIVENTLNINSLKYTSTSDTSPMISKLLDEGNSDALNFAFMENSFDNPFIITTFVQFFESIFSSSPSKLLKLKNYQKKIFLFDEIQSLDPSLYQFIYQFIVNFCEKYDCYAIISTATMPYFISDYNAGNKKLKSLFKTIKTPVNLLSPDIFEHEIFNRYNINFLGELTIQKLYNDVYNSSDSTLVILNTKKDTYSLYNEFEINGSKFDKVYLLNTDESPSDRLKLIKSIREDLDSKNKKILVISTQLIEAGVDIDFPKVYRDLAPHSSISQSGGRCNRNGTNTGDMYIFLLYNYNIKNNKQYSCDLIYRGLITKQFKNIVLGKGISSEKDFYSDIKRYFLDLSEYVETGKMNTNFNIIDAILDGKFEDIGKYFKIIDDDLDSKTVYVGNDSLLWSNYESEHIKYISCKNINEKQKIKIKLFDIKKSIVQNSISISNKKIQDKNIDIDDTDILGVFRLVDSSVYSSEFGLYAIAEI